jgi:hypothetical protein
MHLQAISAVDQHGAQQWSHEIHASYYTARTSNQTNYRRARSPTYNTQQCNNQPTAHLVGGAFRQRSYPQDALVVGPAIKASNPTSARQVAQFRWHASLRIEAHHFTPINRLFTSWWFSVFFAVAASACELNLHVVAAWSEQVEWVHHTHRLPCHLPHNTKCHTLLLGHPH